MKKMTSVEAIAQFCLRGWNFLDEGKYKYNHYTRLLKHNICIEIKEQNFEILSVLIQEAFPPYNLKKNYSFTEDVYFTDLHFFEIEKEAKKCLRHIFEDYYDKHMPL
jgi:deoxyadenosine/deoxycytidine kinase